MKKCFIMAVATMLVSIVSFGQTTNSKIEEAKKNPKTVENAAKADAQVVQKKAVDDKATLKTMFSKKKKATAKKRKSPYRRTA